MPAEMTLSPALRRNLSLRDLVVFGLLFIGPLAPVGVFGVLDAKADGAVALVYVLATLAMSCTAWSYAQMSRVIPRAGSVFSYASEGLGAGAGFIAGWMAMLDYLFIPAVAYLFSGIALHALVPAIPAWVFTVVAFAITTWFNLRGVSVAARAGRIVLSAEIVVLAIFIVSACVALLTHGVNRPILSPFTGMGALGTDAPSALSAVGGAVSIAVLSYLGFDAIASFAEENAGDPRNVGRAILYCLVGAGIVFVAQSFLAGLLSTGTPATLRASPNAQGTAFYDVARTAIGAWLATTLAVTKAVGPAFAAMTGQAAAGRLLFGMAREGRLPRTLAVVNSKRGVPLAALVTAACLTLVVAVWAAQRDDGLSVLVSIVDVGALSAFALLHLSVVGYFLVKRRAEHSLAHVAIPIAGLAVTLWVLAESSGLAQVIGGVWLGIGLATTSFVRGGGADGHVPAPGDSP